MKTYYEWLIAVSITILTATFVGLVVIGAVKSLRSKGE